MKRIKRNLFPTFILLVTAFLMLASPLSAQFIPETEPQEEETEAPAEEQPVPDIYDRETPRGTVRGFLSAVANQDYEEASVYLNIVDSLQHDSAGKELAIVLQRLLDQGALIPTARLANDPEGLIDDGLPQGTERVGTVTADGETVEVLLEKTVTPEGSEVWLFSAATISEIIQAEVEDVWIDQQLPDPLSETLWFGAPASHWLAMLVLLIAAFFLAWGITWLIRFILNKIWKSSTIDPTKGVIASLALPVSLYLAVWLFVLLSQQAGISIVLRQRFSGLTIIAAVVAILIFLWQLSGFIGRFTSKRMTQRGNVSGTSIVLFLQRAARFVIAVLGAIMILDVVGIDVTAGLAALGIGGLALAFGAQKTIENFIGGVSVIADQPVRVGDFCVVGDVVGTVEKIGMRSTKIRTLARTIVTIPNGEFSAARIENFAHRDRFLFNPTFEMRYETTPDQLRFLLVEIRAILYSHPKVSPDPARIRFVALGKDSIKLEIFSYITAVSFDEYLEVQEDVLLRIMEVVDISGTGFAIPAQTVYFTQDTGLSEEKAEKVKERVKKWKEENELQIPHFDPAKIRELENKINYPPDGSVDRKNEQK